MCDTDRDKKICREIQKIPDEPLLKRTCSFLRRDRHLDFLFLFHFYHFWNENWSFSLHQHSNPLSFRLFPRISISISNFQPPSQVNYSTIPQADFVGERAGVVWALQSKETCRQRERWRRISPKRTIAWALSDEDVEQTSCYIPYVKQHAQGPGKYRNLSGCWNWEVDNHLDMPCKGWWWARSLELNWNTENQGISSRAAAYRKDKG